MALIDARLLRTFKLTETKGEKGSVQFTGSEEYLVLADAKDPSYNSILEDKTVWANLGNRPLPQIDDEVVVSGVSLYCTSRSLSYYKDNERAVQMTVVWDAKDDAKGGDGDPNNNDPEAWQRITVQSTDITKPARGFRQIGEGFDAPLDRLQSPAINSAGDPVDGLEEQASLLQVTYTNTIAANPNFEELFKFCNTCNFDQFPFLGVFIASYTMRCTGFNAQYDQKNNTWSVSVEFLYSPDGWALQYYDVGFNEVIDGKRVAILDTRGNPVSSPVALNGQGRAAAFANPADPETNPQFEPEVRTLYPYISKNFRDFFQKARI